MLSLIKKEQQDCNNNNNIEKPVWKYMKVDLSTLPIDPGDRPSMECYHVTQRDEIRIAYLRKGPFQPRNHCFKRREIGRRLRKFSSSWFNDHKYWLEYSVKKEAAFCLCCYLFMSEIRNRGGADSFGVGGFKSWNKKERLDLHNVGSPHNQAVQKCRELMSRLQLRLNDGSFEKQCDVLKNERGLLRDSVDCVRFMLRQRVPFNGYDEKEELINRGNFQELLQFYVDRNEKGGDGLVNNVPKNLGMEYSSIQKDIVRVAAKETIKVITQEVGDDFFGIIVGETRDVSSQVHMALVLRYVNNEGIVVERFVGIKCVGDTSPLSLKATLYSMLSECGLSPSRIRGQFYEGASDMKDAFNGLKNLVMEETRSAYSVHCFAHEMQFSLVFVAKNHFLINDFFELISRLLNLIRSVYKRQAQLKEKQITKVVEALVEMRNTSIKRPGYTHLGSHYGSLLYIMIIYSSVCEVLEAIKDDNTCQNQRAEARRLLKLLKTFEFVFCLHFMVEILGITNELSTTLNKKDQDIVNVVHLVRASKQRLHEMRNEGWSSLLDTVASFCNKYNVEILNMEHLYADQESCCNGEQVSNLHHYQIDVFSSVIDMQLQELNDRFNEVNTALLVSMSSFCPCKCFQEFNEDRLLKMAELYPSEFSKVELETLREQLQNFIFDIRGDARFNLLTGIGEFAKKMVETSKHTIYPMVYLLLKLALILPVVTSSVERTCSAMKLIKSELTNKTGDQFTNDCLVSYIEKDVLDGISNETILKFF